MCTTFSQKICWYTYKGDNPFAYTYYETVSDDNIYLFVSQSGYSTNILGAAQKHKENHRKVIGITGNRESDLGKMSDICLEYGAGEETIGYVTKGMSTLILFFMLLGLELTVKKMQRLIRSCSSI